MPAISPAAAHFAAAAPIWAAFQAGQISASRRDALLAPLRLALADWVPPADAAARFRRWAEA